MEAIELILNLLKKPKEEIQEALLILLISKKIDFVELSKSYVEYLEYLKEDNQNQLIEAETCVMESFMHPVVKKDFIEDDKHGDWMSTQRRLYLLNKSKRFQMKELNDKYHYQEDKAKNLSWYERNKSKIKEMQELLNDETFRR